MTADQAIDFAKFMRPGVVLKVGALDAVEFAEPSADEQPIWRKNALGIKPAHEYPRWHSTWLAGKAAP